MSGSDDPTAPPRDPPSANQHSSESLMPVVYDNQRQLAEAWFRREQHPRALEPTAMVHEAYLRLADQDLPEIRGRTHFFAIAAREMRRMLVDHARANKAQKRGGAHRRVTLHDDLPDGPVHEVDMLALDDALERLAKLHERQAQVVQLRYFGGLTVPEVAEHLGVSVGTIEKDWRIARAWLLREIGSQNTETAEA